MTHRTASFIGCFLQRTILTLGLAVVLSAPVLHGQPSATPPSGPPNVAQTGTPVFIYGQAAPVVMCAPLRVCVFELAPGERVSDKLLAGDAERWIFDVTTSGINGGTQLLSIKPTECDLATNLVVPTDRRVYHVSLRSLPCVKRAGAVATDETAFTRAFRFTTGDVGLNNKPDGHHTADTTNRRMPAPRTVAATPPPSTARPLNFAYGWTKDRRIRWRPELVFDDGLHTYIKLPLTGGAAVAPALFALDEDGTTTVINYTTDNGFYVTDRLARRFVLAAGGNSKSDRIVIENRRWR